MQLEGTIIGLLQDRHGNIKKQFRPNFLWKYLQENYKKDIKIPLLTGVWSDFLYIRNNMADNGLATAVDFLGGINSRSPIVAGALGTSTPTSNALGNEVIRGETVNTIYTTTITDDTLQCTVSFTFDGDYTLTEEGLFDDPSVGNLIAFKVIPAVPVAATDVYTLTHRIQAKNE